jgi:hypothetical protein
VPTNTSSPTPTSPPCDLLNNGGDVEKVTLSQNSWEGTHLDGNFNSTAQKFPSTKAVNHFRYEYINATTFTKTLDFTGGAPANPASMGFPKFGLAGSFFTGNLPNMVTLFREIDLFVWISKQAPPTSCFSGNNGCQLPYTLYKVVHQTAIYNHNGSALWSDSASQLYSKMGGSNEYHNNGNQAPLPLAPGKPVVAKVTRNSDGLFVDLNNDVSYTIPINGCAANSGFYMGFSISVKDSGPPHQYIPWGDHVGQTHHRWLNVQNF